MTRYIKRGGKVWIKIFPDKPVTAKPAETRMGSGKGALEYWVAVVKQAAYYLKSLVYQRKQLGKLCVLQCTSCHASVRLLLKQI